MQIERPKSKQPIPENAKRVFQGVLFDVYQWEQELFDGTRTIFEKIKRLDTVVVFPVLPDGKILISEEKQPGVEPVWGTVSGRIERDEDILSAAKRELLEETGYEAGDLVLWKALQPLAKVEWAVYVFIGRKLKKVALPELDGGEKIEFTPMTLDELINMAAEKPITFYEPELLSEFFSAKINPEKRKELEELFEPL